MTNEALTVQPTSSMTHGKEKDCPLLTSISILFPGASFYQWNE